MTAQLKESNTLVISLQTKLAAKEEEIADAKLELRNESSSNNQDELNRLQMMLFELKTTRVDLLEKLDDSEHENALLRQEILQLKQIK
jgi:hypothetical protein